MALLFNGSRVCEYNIAEAKEQLALASAENKRAATRHLKNMEASQIWVGFVCERAKDEMVDGIFEKQLEMGLFHHAFKLSDDEYLCWCCVRQGTGNTYYSSVHRHTIMEFTSRF